MPLLDVSDAILSGDLAESFTVQRSTGGSFQLGGWQSTTTEIQMSGVVSPAGPKQLMQVPEGDRALGAVVFHTKPQLYVTHNDSQPGLSDIIIWQGESYRLHNVSPYGPRGYWRAVGTRIVGD